MLLGVQFLDPPASVERDAGPLRRVLRHAEDLAEAGISRIWLAQGFSYDALTALGHLGSTFTDLSLGTAVVPTYSRHPLTLGMQATTVQEMIGRRLTLGIGPSHRQVVERVFGVPYVNVVDHTRGYLTTLLKVLDRDLHQSRLGAIDDLRSDPAGRQRPRVLLGALGPEMVKLAGEVADGTVTSRAGPRALSTAIVPGLHKAAAAAGRPTPDVAACLAFCVTADESRARERIAAEQTPSMAFRSYRRLCELEGVRSPSDLAIVGTEEKVEAGLRRLADAGVNEFLAQVTGTPEEILRSITFLGAAAHQ
jgi:F420-dependent oxidoreductase-like protein